MSKEERRPILGTGAKQASGGTQRQRCYPAPPRTRRHWRSPSLCAHPQCCLSPATPTTRRGPTPVLAPLPLLPHTRRGQTLTLARPRQLPRTRLGPMLTLTTPPYPTGANTQACYSPVSRRGPTLVLARPLQVPVLNGGRRPRSLAPRCSPVPNGGQCLRSLLSRCFLVEDGGQTLALAHPRQLPEPDWARSSRWILFRTRMGPTLPRTRRGPTLTLARPAYPTGADAHACSSPVLDRGRRLRSLVPSNSPVPNGSRRSRSLVPRCSQVPNGGRRLRSLVPSWSQVPNEGQRMRSLVPRCSLSPTGVNACARSLLLALACPLLLPRPQRGADAHARSSPASRCSPVPNGGRRSCSLVAACARSSPLLPSPQRGPTHALARPPAAPRPQWEPTLALHLSLTDDQKKGKMSSAGV